MMSLMPIRNTLKPTLVKLARVTSKLMTHTSYSNGFLILDSYKDTPRDTLTKLAKYHPDFEKLKQLDDMDLCLALCEGWAASLVEKNTHV